MAKFQNQERFRTVIWKRCGKTYLENILLHLTVSVLRLFNKKAVIAALFKLHDDIQEA